MNNEELLAHLAETIVEPEVMGKLEQLDSMTESDWSARTHEDNPQAEETPIESPEPEVKPDDPAKPAEITVEATTPLPTIDWESLRDSSTGLILNKYKTGVDATKGVGHAVAMAKQAFDKADELALENERLRQQIALSTQTQATPTIRQPDVMPAEVTELDSVLAKIVNEGGTLDEQNITELKIAMSKQSRSIAASTVEEVLSQREAKVAAENATWMKVEDHMRTNFPESLKFADEMSLFVKSDPLYGPAVRGLIKDGKALEATELAWRGFSQAQNIQVATTQRVADEKKEIQLLAGDEVRREAVEQARRDAGIQTTVAGGVHETPISGASEEEIDRARREMLTTGLGENWRRLTIAKDLKGPLFD